MSTEFRPLSVQVEKMSLLSRGYWTDLDNAYDSGRPVVYCFGMGPQEVFRAIDAVIFYGDNFASACAIAGESQDLCEVAESKGFPMELCSYARVHIGATLSARNPMGKPLPKPDFLVYPSGRCNVYSGWCKVLKEMYPDVHVMPIDIPALRDEMSEDERERARTHVKRQIQAIIDFVDGWKGHGFDHDSFAEMVDNTARAGRGLLALMDTIRVVPAPITMYDIFYQLFPLLCWRGRPQAVEYYALAKAEVDQRIEQGFAAVPGEKFRIYWDGIAIWTRLAQQFRQLARHRAVLVSSSYANYIAENCAQYDMSDPIGSCAGWMMRSFTNWGLGAKVDYVTRLATDFGANGIIMQVSRSCKPFFLDEQAIIKGVVKRTGLPYCEVHGDMADPRLYSAQAIEDRIDTFLTGLVAGP